jgi:hypothetical protein
MTIGHGIALFLLGGLVTIAFFILWFKAMEAEDKKINNNERYV